MLAVNCLFFVDYNEITAPRNRWGQKDDFYMINCALLSNTPSNGVVSAKTQIGPWRSQFFEPEQGLFDFQKTKKLRFKWRTHCKNKTQQVIRTLDHFGILRIHPAVPVFLNHCTLKHILEGCVTFCIWLYKEEKRETRVCNKNIEVPKCTKPTNDHWIERTI